MKIHPFFHTATSTLTYLVWDETSRDAIVIDPVLDFDPVRVVTSEEAVDELIAFVRSQNLTVHYTLETHVHADHLSGAQALKAKLNSKMAVGSRVVEIQSFFGPLFDMDSDFNTNGAQFDQLLDDGAQLSAGSLTLTAIHTPGHTPACTSYLVGDALFTGDTVFMPDFGTGRCDFPSGSAADLFDSITQKIFTLPDSTRLFVGHDYQPGGRALAYETTVLACKTENAQLGATTQREDFVSWREARDATLKLPKLIFQSVQVNINGGLLPKAKNGVVHLKLPMNVL